MKLNIRTVFGQMKFHIFPQHFASTRKTLRNSRKFSVWPCPVIRSTSSYTVSTKRLRWADMSVRSYATLKDSRASAYAPWCGCICSTVRRCLNLVHGSWDLSRHSKHSVTSNPYLVTGHSIYFIDRVKNCPKGLRIKMENPTLGTTHGSDAITWFSE